MKLKSYIHERQYTIKELAEKLDMNNITISYWCNGKNLGQIKKFIELCKILEIDINKLEL